MIIDIGARTTTIGIFDNKNIFQLSVVISIAGNNFTNAIAKKLNIKNDEAEKMKRSLGFDDKKSDNKIFSILQESFQKIIKETNDAIQYYERETGDKIEEIIDARTSDAIALALRFQAPIFTYKNILDKAILKLIICPSKLLQKCIAKEGFKTTFIPYFINCTKNTSRPKGKTILYVGALTPQKGVHVLLGRAVVAQLPQAP